MKPEDEMVKNVKEALTFLGPRVVTALLMDCLVKRRDNACNKASKTHLRKVAIKIESALNAMDDFPCP